MAWDVTTKRNIALWGMGWSSAYAVVPYVWATQGETLREAGIALPTLLGVVTLQGGLYFALASFAGGWACERLSWSTPVVRALVERGDVKSAMRAIAPRSAAIGVAAGVITLGMSSLFAPHLPAQLHEAAERVTWQGLPASFYGGIGEEIVMRFFLLSLLTLAAVKLSGRPRASFWIANVVVALAFGAGHVLGVVGTIPITPTLWAYALVLNGWLALLFGWLFRRYGLEAAMVAHFCVDIVLHVWPALASF